MVQLVPKWMMIRVLLYCCSSRNSVCNEMIQSFCYWGARVASFLPTHDSEKFTAGFISTLCFLRPCISLTSRTGVGTPSPKLISDIRGLTSRILPGHDSQCQWMLCSSAQMEKIAGRHGDIINPDTLARANTSLPAVSCIGMSGKQRWTFSLASCLMNKTSGVG